MIHSQSLTLRIPPQSFRLQSANINYTHIITMLLHDTHQADINFLDSDVDNNSGTPHSCRSPTVISLEECVLQAAHARSYIAICVCLPLAISVACRLWAMLIRRARVLSRTNIQCLATFAVMSSLFCRGFNIPYTL